MAQLEVDRRSDTAQFVAISTEVARLQVWVKVLIGVASILSPAITAGLTKILGG